MTYKTILVQLADARRTERLLAVALPLARRMKAHLIGLCVIPPYVVIPGGEVGGTTVTVDAHREAYQTEAATIKAAFLKAVAGETIQVEWREADAGFGTAAAVVVGIARSADLVVVSQRDKSWTYSEMLEDPDRIVIECGRPMLIVPNAGIATSQAKRITVAWNGTRESARAVFDALPVLQHADDVNVLSIATKITQDSAVDVPAAEICATLARHGVKCQASSVTANSAQVGSELKRQAENFGSDLLVMGCYGHTRLREFILGGASREVLAAMEIPVLMSH